MATRDTAPLGAPCWVDLLTSDVEASRCFYSELFGWEAGEPAAEYHGYFMFTRDGAPIAGVMGEVGSDRVTDTWRPFFATTDVERTTQLATAHGATVALAATPIADLGSQAVIIDVLGAVTGIWQPNTFAGFTAIHEHGTPSFIAIDVPDYHRQVAFYRTVFGWDPLEEENDGHHYAGFMDLDNHRPIAGIGDEVESLEPDEVPSWSVFWQCDDVDVSVAAVTALGGAVITEPLNGGLGRAARVADPTGARFWLFHPRR